MAQHLFAHLLLHASPLAKELLVHGRFRQQSIHHHGVAGDVEEREIRVGATRLVDHHALGRDDEPHARALLQQPTADLPQTPVQQPLDVTEHLRARQGHGDHAAGERGDDRGDGALDHQQQSQSPARDVWQGDEAQCRVRRRAVDHDEVVVARLRVGLDRKKRGEFFGTRQQRELLGHHLVDPLIAKQGDEIVADAPPVSLHLNARIDLDCYEVGGQLYGLRPDGCVRGVSE